MGTINLARAINSKTEIAAQKSRVIEIEPEKLIDDPANVELHPGYEEDVAALAEAMRQYGMQGVILAYPYGDSYMIESGHRRKYAAIEAGLKTVTVFVTVPPEDDIDKGGRLAHANTHGRKYTTMGYARFADFLVKNYTLENEKCAKKGLPSKGVPTERAAKDLEISQSQISKYRALMKLSPELQSLLDTKTDVIPWTPFNDAVGMNEEQSHLLYVRLKEEIEWKGAENITRKFIEDAIVECYTQKKLSPQDTLRPETKTSDKVRRSDGAKAAHKGCRIIYDSLDSSLSYIKEEDKEKTLDELKQLSEFLNGKIAELEGEGFSKKFSRKKN